MEPQAIAQWPIFVGTAITVLLTFVWMGIHARGLHRWLSHTKETGGAAPMSKLAAGAWIASGASGFMGPCVLLVSLVTLVLGVVVLLRVRKGSDVEASRGPAITTVMASAAIVLMGIILTAAIAATQLLSA